MNISCPLEYPWLGLTRGSGEGETRRVFIQGDLPDIILQQGQGIDQSVSPAGTRHRSISFTSRDKASIDQFHQQGQGIDQSVSPAGTRHRSICFTSRDKASIDVFHQ
ncbi:hypothetical protein [Microseira sp. BLCC-F43]|uniref:hypothetical protein n=1 Tax=Microseira sp. BLCC-F43 TaxID=3153602 RepID=UPI0035BA2C66